jgi:alpha-1,2-mannosyltransferase
VAPRSRWWDLVRPPIVGVTVVVLLAVASALVAGHARLWHTTADERAGQDFGIFLASVRHSLAGRSLYAPTPLRWRTHATGTAPLNLNLPHTNLLIWPLAVLPDREALIAWTWAGLVLFVVTSAVSLRALGWRWRWLPALAALVYLLAWAPSAAFSLTAQVSFLLMLPVTMAWLARRRGRSRAAGVWLGVAAAMKPFLLIFLPYFAIRRDREATLAMASTVAVVFAAGVLVFGVEAYLEWARQLPRITWSAHYFNASFTGVLQRSLGRSYLAVVADRPDLVLPLAAALSLAVTAVTFLAIARRRSPDVDAEWTALLLASLLISPLGWNYYLWIAVWPAAALIAGLAPWRNPRVQDLWLAGGLLGWLWWSKMTLWGQPHPLATVTFGSMYFWALLSMWLWTVTRLASPRPSGGS